MTPPYYGLTFTARGGSKKKQYLTDERAVVHWKTQEVYKRSLDIDLTYHHRDPSNPGAFTTTDYHLEGDNYDAFVRIVMEVGETLDNLSRELVIDPLILEALTVVSQYLTPETMRPEELRDMIGADQVTYDPRGHILNISVGREDYVIPLHKVREKIYEKLMPLLKKIEWRRIQVYITSLSNLGLKRREVTIGQLYSTLKSFDNLFHVEKFKGLGGMPPADCFTTCMDPRYRTSHQITQVSDVDVIFQLLGKNSEYRKRLLVGQTNPW